MPVANTVGAALSLPLDGSDPNLDVYNLTLILHDGGSEPLHPTSLNVYEFKLRHTGTLRNRQYCCYRRTIPADRLV